MHEGVVSSSRQWDKEIVVVRSFVLFGNINVLQMLNKCSAAKGLTSTTRAPRMVAKAGLPLPQWTSPATVATG